MQTPNRPWQHVILISGIILVALNLRPAVTVVGPLAERMHLEGLSREAIGALTTIPLILFGLAGLWAGWIGGRIGYARTLGLGLLVLSLGCYLRSVPDEGAGIWRLVGTILIGTGIALGNVLLPSVVKSRYPDHIGPLTSLYSTALNLGAAFGIALAVPLADRLPGGWPASLASWGVVAFVSFLLWSPQMRHTPELRPRSSPFASIAVLARQKRAWQITIHMGLQSMLFYSSVAWLPTVLQSRGLDETEAAHWVAAMQVLGCVASLVVPTLASRQPSQSAWVVGCALTSAISLIGILCLPTSLVGVAVLTLGLGLNASFGLALLLIAVRSHDTDTSAGLSSMAQAGGYLLAAPGPLLIGWFQTLTDSWTYSFGAIVILAMMTAGFGFFAGRAGTLRLTDQVRSLDAL